MLTLAVVAVGLADQVLMLHQVQAETEELQPHHQ
jgi:hypothetical protein